MSDNACRYAVARTKALEVSLFTDGDIAELMACKSYEAGINFLLEKGWGSPDSGNDLSEILKAETEKTWDEIHGMMIDESVFAPLSYRRLYHNLNAAIKDVITQSDVGDRIYCDDVEISGSQMRRIIEEKDYFALPGHMMSIAQEAVEVMLHTGDGQLCDSIVDRGCLEAMEKAAMDTGIEFLIDYVKSVVAVSNIRIALRAAKTHRTREFLDRAMASTDAVNVMGLKNAAASGVDSVIEFLAAEGMSDAAKAASESNSAFERWCDNMVIHTIQSQLYKSESPGPVIAYLLARENEIKTVRIILTCKQNKLDEEDIKERVREMYV